MLVGGNPAALASLPMKTSDIFIFVHFVLVDTFRHSGRSISRNPVIFSVGVSDPSSPLPCNLPPSINANVASRYVKGIILGFNFGWHPILLINK